MHDIDPLTIKISDMHVNDGMQITDDELNAVLSLLPAQTIVSSEVRRIYERRNNFVSDAYDDFNTAYGGRYDDVIEITTVRRVHAYDIDDAVKFLDNIADTHKIALLNANIAETEARIKAQQEEIEATEKALQEKKLALEALKK